MGKDAPIKISLKEQAAAAQRELKAREHIYPTRVQVGTMTTADAEHELALMAAIAKTLTLFADHEDAIREALAVSIAAKKRALELADLEDHPDVAAVIDAFPDAEIVEVRDINS